MEPCPEFPQPCPRSYAVTSGTGTRVDSQLEQRRCPPGTRRTPSGDTPALLLWARLLQHLIGREGGQEPLHGPSVLQVRLQLRLLVRDLAHRGQGRHADHPLHLPPQRLLLGREHSTICTRSRSRRVRTRATAAYGDPCPPFSPPAPEQQREQGKSSAHHAG